MEDLHARCHLYMTTTTVGTRWWLPSARPVRTGMGVAIRAARTGPEGILAGPFQEDGIA